MDIQEKSKSDKKKARNKRYYQKHKIEILAQAKVYHEERKRSLSEKEKHRKQSKAYYARTKDDPERKAVRKSCSQSWYQKNRDRILREMKEWRQQMLGTIEYRFKRAIQTAKQRDIPFLLSFDQFSLAAQQACYYCNGQFCDPVLEGSGLDRLDSNKGYEAGNVVSCGFRCNAIKMDDLTAKEAKAAIEAILKIRERK